MIVEQYFKTSGGVTITVFMQNMMTMSSSATRIVEKFGTLD